MKFKDTFLTEDKDEFTHHAAVTFDKQKKPIILIISAKLLTALDFCCVSGKLTIPTGFCFSIMLRFILDFLESLNNVEKTLVIDIYSNLFNYIAIHQRKLEQLKNLKKTLILN